MTWRQLLAWLFRTPLRAAVTVAVAVVTLLLLRDVIKTLVAFAFVMLFLAWLIRYFLMPRPQKKKSSR